jgi:hypothetical protein
MRKIRAIYTPIIMPTKRTDKPQEKQYFHQGNVIFSRSGLANDFHVWLVINKLSRSLA